jgi:para-aminobenzoate synthetase/4-amino-4-deoxychorismate lyase
MVNKEKLLSFLLDYLAQERDFVFLWNGRTDENNYQSYVFTSPVKCICCFEKREFIEALLQIEEILHQGYYLAGFISYEAGLCLEDIVPFESSPDFPLLWFGVYEAPVIYDHKNGCFSGARDMEALLEQHEPRQDHLCQVGNVRNTIGKETYVQDITSVREAIARGDTYQVNYTFKHKFDFDGSAEDLFRNLCMKQSASYTAFVRCLDRDILSLSPELFFRRNAEHVVAKPMKGTIERGINNADDINKAEELHNSLKNRAENVMIVDLLRNDLGRISRTGSVRVDKLYEIERYETLFQMTSTIRSELNDNVNWFQFFRSMFPCGSVTGAPKINTMRIIDRLEKEPRGVYTGSIGYIAPDSTSVFSVAIRTVVLDRLRKRGEMGIGSGIVYDSDPHSEFDECLLKASFLTTRYVDFQLIETMLWQSGEFYLLGLHLKRLADSAEYFHFIHDKNQIIQALTNESKTFRDQGKYRVRMLLHRDGTTTVTSTQLDDTDSEPKHVIFSTVRTDPGNRFLYHKTTNRELYNSEFQKVRAEGYYDALFLNTRGEVTEGAISNIFVMNNGKLYTPPVECGLLNGVFRQHLLVGDIPLEERVLCEDDILEAEKLYLSNSVRGMVEVNLQANKLTNQ